MVCEHPDWGFVECYREVTGIDYKLLERLCDKHKHKIIAEDLTIAMKKSECEPEKPKLTLKQISEYI
jgi:hypothetical protein